MASKHLDETWIASMKDLLTNYADTIVSNIIQSYKLLLNKRKKMILTGRDDPLIKNNTRVMKYISTLER